ncbi:FG-GAP repeat domain-containing protein [Pleomorphovibrio marinus]|uniref:FG-GAP repeat domain-containing protein n=1 Tax=Pleomorphovibrio marinus TaxID=2164132 RepID=UPI000E09E93C|nr:VCBS repeat-containing protein [Pleomorphovibrio marinus]
MTLKHYCFPIFLLLTLNPFGNVSAQQVDGSTINFSKQTLTQEFLAEGVAVGDVNRDGLLDVMVGSYWFEAPHWKKHALTTPEVFEYDKGYSNAFISYGMDVNQDGWVDFVRIGFPGKEVQWFENPKGKEGHWKAHIIHETLGNESAGFYDIDGDGRMDILGSIPETGEMVWFQAPSGSSNLTWKMHTISKPGSPSTGNFAHGLGAGDMNGNGRMDVIITEGWWEAPEDPTKGPWQFHEANLGEASAQMHAMDITGNGLMDVISSSAHQLGIWWHEQIKGPNGGITWQTHLIDDTFTQTHGLELVDINGNGNLDLVTGKRYYAHMGKDPGAEGPAYVYWYEFNPGPSPTWTGHMVDDDSGVGVHVVCQDMNGNGWIDIVSANKKGVFVFFQER